MIFGRKDSPSLVQLLKDLFSDAVRYLQVELDLVRARFAKALRHAGLGIGLLLGAAIIGFLGFTGLLVTAGLALAIVLPGWAAALIVAGAVLGLATFLGLSGVQQLRAASRARTAGPPEIEGEAADTRYRLEADLDALSAKLDPRHKASARTNGHSPAGSRTSR